ncbi:hypothetical protein B0H66DRAFT_629460 [Apodospora peruviana]|uniref:Gamma-glutamylcyclotransferase AIG2-like domain-containing protein n=1 Tax=Apodospora peruviana TaxID=516989 RepID=A0AAE0HV69_9PEZI|nr:hypothetical protein B0H66DRAFT_629460 [Apodospora peruviana]
MDAWDGLESIARAATLQHCTPEDEPHADTVERWQALFGYTYAEAVQQIKDKRRDLGQTTLSEASWETISADREAEGFDKETYEHSCWLARSKSARHHAVVTGPPPPPLPAGQKRVIRPQIYLLKLEGPLPTPNSLASGLLQGQRGRKGTILGRFSDMKSSFEPIFIHYSVAEKSLSDICVYPTLGIDTTLPQHRATQSVMVRPAQDEDPVWYFFYGTLVDPAVLKRLLELDREPTYRSAKVLGGKL